METKTAKILKDNTSNQTPDNVVESLVPIPKLSRTYQGMAANTNLLDQNLKPTYPASVFHITVAVTASGIFKAILSSGNVNHTLSFNSGIALVADALYGFDMLVSYGDEINFQTDTAANITIRVQEALQ